MKNEFVSYEIALELKQLDFDEPCFATYQYPSKDLVRVDADSEGVRNSNLVRFTSAPLIQHAFRWFREKKYQAEILWRGDFCWRTRCFKQGSNLFSEDGFKTYEEAEVECLLKLIEIIKNIEYEKGICKL